MEYVDDRNHFTDMSSGDLLAIYLHKYLRDSISGGLSTKDEGRGVGGA